jgi:AcrR family transcriptional regulator
MIGISEQAIYRHFDSKMDILLSILDYFNRSFQDMAAKMKMPNDAAGKIRILTNEHLVFFDKNHAFAAVIFSEEIFQNEPQCNATQKSRHILCLLCLEFFMRHL